MALVEITADAFGVEIDIVYATERNFTGRPVYRRPACYLHPDAAAALAQAVVLADELGVRLRILDAFRPREAQFKLWEHTPDPDFLAHPVSGSPHSRGVAVDLTLIGPHGAELDMGTGFDAFTPRSHHGNRDVSPEAQRHRHLLLGLMTASGWDFYRNEWWHYQLFRPRAYPLLSDDAVPRPMM
jgi:D-alanyl-D-alanine dipeptidase